MTQDRIIGVYDTQDEAQKSLEALSKASIPFSKLAIQPPIKKRKNCEYVTVGDVEGSTIAVGSIWGACIGLIVGFLTFAVIEGSATYDQRFFRLLISLMMGTTLGALTGAVIAALVSTTMARSLNAQLNKRLFVGKYLVTMQATHKEIKRARTLVEHTGT